MTDLKSLNRVELEQFFKELGEPKFRAKQVFQWLWRGVESFDEMTNLSKALREKLRQSCILTVPQVALFHGKRRILPDRRADQRTQILQSIHLFPDFHQ